MKPILTHTWELPQLLSSQGIYPDFPFRLILPYLAVMIQHYPRSKISYLDSLYRVPWSIPASCFEALRWEVFAISQDQSSRYHPRAQHHHPSKPLSSYVKSATISIHDIAYGYVQIDEVFCGLKSHPILPRYKAHHRSK